MRWFIITLVPHICLWFVTFITLINPSPHCYNKSPCRPDKTQLLIFTFAVKSFLILNLFDCRFRCFLFLSSLLLLSRFTQIPLSSYYFSVRVFCFGLCCSVICKMRRVRSVSFLSTVSLAFLGACEWVGGDRQVQPSLTTGICRPV